VLQPRIMARARSSRRPRRLARLAGADLKSAFPRSG
jgi:hypothetical protein